MLSLFINSLGLSINSNKFITESEIKQGRMAMLATTIIPTLELFDKDGLGINELYNSPLQVQTCVFGLVGLSEVAQLFKAYEFPTNTSNWFQMKEDHVPGEYNFDPLGLYNENNKNMELNIGRLAMLGAAGMIGQELVGQRIVNFD